MNTLPRYPSKALPSFKENYHNSILLLQKENAWSLGGQVINWLFKTIELKLMIHQRWWATSLLLILLELARHNEKLILGPEDCETSV